MKRKTTLILLICGAVLTVTAVSYVVLQKKEKSTTVCKTPKSNKTSTPNKPNTTNNSSNNSNNTSNTSNTNNTSSSNETGSNNSKVNPPKDSQVNTVGNTSDNIINGGAAAKQDKWVYFNCGGLCRAMEDMTTGWQRLNWDSASNINVIGEWIYYTKGSTLYKIKTDGSNKTELFKGTLFNVIATPQWLFYINFNDRNIYKMDLNGQNISKLSNGSYISFNLIDDWIYFEELNSEPQLYKMDINGGNKTITSPPVQFNCPNNENPLAFNRGKDYMFYITADLKLYKVKYGNDKEQPSIICDLSKYQSNLNPSSIIAFDNFLLIYWDRHIYKIDFNGNILTIDN